MSQQMVRDMEFVIETMFPESEIPALHELLEASERRFDLISVRNDAEDYRRTCRELLSTLQAHRADAERIVGPGVVANYERFLGAFADAFDERHLDLARTVCQAV